MEFHCRMYGVSRRMCYVRVLYVWRMKCTRDESTAYVLRSILICGVSVLYQIFLITIRTNGSFHFVHAIRILQLSIIRGRGSPRITCYRELGGSGKSEVNNGRRMRLGAVFILFYFQFTSTLEILAYRTYKV